jgi:hypothetical protein
VSTLESDSFLALAGPWAEQRLGFLVPLLDLRIKLFLIELGGESEQASNASF